MTYHEPAAVERTLKHSQVVVSLLMLCLAASVGRADPLPEEVSTALEEAAAELGNVSVTWVEKVRPTSDTKAASEKRAAEADLSHIPEGLRGVYREALRSETPDETVACEMHRQDGMLYFKKESSKKQGSNGSLETFLELAYDKQDVQFGSRTRTAMDDATEIGKKNNPVLQLYKEEDLAEAEDGRHWGSDRYLNAAGFFMPNQMKNITEPARHLLSQAAESGASFEVADVDYKGRKCVLIKVIADNESQRWVLDPAIGYAARSYEVFENGARVSSTENDGFVQIGVSSLWLPKKCAVDWHVWREPGPFEVQQPLSEVVMKVSLTTSELKRQALPADQFTLDYQQPGNLVLDSRFPEAKDDEHGFVRYTVPASAEHLDDVIAHARANTGKRVGSWRGAIFLVNVLLTGCIVAWIVIRRRASRS